MVDDNKRQGLEIIEKRIAFWTDFSKRCSNSEFDTEFVLDNLYKEKQDFLYGTHSLTIKHLSNRLMYLEAELESINPIKRRKIKKIIKDVQDTIDYLTKLDSKIVISEEMELKM